MNSPHEGLPAPLEHAHPPLQGLRVCLVFEFALEHYSRLLQEIGALRAAGADVRLVTSHPSPETLPFTLHKDVVPLANLDGAPDLGPARSPGVSGQLLGSHPAQRARHLVRSIRNTRRRARLLESVARDTDVFWVIDYPSLPTTSRAARRSGTPVVYETVDLVPEYLYRGRLRRLLALRGERRLIGRVDGFITACDSYADYYEERYGTLLAARPTVIDNVPAHIVDHPGQTRRPLRLLFLGSLMHDRPIPELISAMAQTAGDATLTLKGVNHLGDHPARLVEELGIADRVRVEAPCGPGEIVEVAAQYDVGIVALRGVDENERRASTMKLLTYMAAGLVILGSDLPGIARIVRTHGNGILVDGTQPEDWARAIDAIAGLPDDQLFEMRRRSIAAAEEHSWDRQREDFVGVFLATLGPSA